MRSKRRATIRGSAAGDRLPAARDAGRDARRARRSTRSSSAPTRRRRRSARCWPRTAPAAAPASAAFAKAWDRFAFARRPRSAARAPATERELRVSLRSHLEASLLRGRRHRAIARLRDRRAPPAGRGPHPRRRPRQPSRHALELRATRNRSRELRNSGRAGRGRAWSAGTTTIERTLATLDAEQPTTSAPASAGAGASGQPARGRAPHQPATASLRRSRAVPARNACRITPDVQADADADGGGSRERRTSAVELLWDLVFVFAITQVTTLLARTPIWARVRRGDARAGARLVGMVGVRMGSQRPAAGDSARCAAAAGGDRADLHRRSGAAGGVRGRLAAVRRRLRRGAAAAPRRSTRTPRGRAMRHGSAIRASRSRSRSGWSLLLAGAFAGGWRRASCCGPRRRRSTTRARRG